MLYARLPLAAVLAAVSAFAFGVAGQDESLESDEPAEVTIGQRGSEQDPLAGRDPVTAAVPEDAGPAKPEGELGIPSMIVKVDPRVLGVAPGEPLPPLRREGETVRKRDGRLLPTGDRGYAVFILDADPEAGDDKPLAMIVAPCMTLESMERLMEDRGDDLRFTVTGVVHTYRGVNYLLPTSQPKPWVVANDDGEQLVEAGEPSDNEAARPAVDDSESADATADGGDDANDESGDDATPSADEVLRQLLEQTREGPEPIDADEDTAQSPAVAPNDLAIDPLLLGLDTDQPLAQLKEEGQFIIARTGRLIQSADGSHALFVLDSDGADAPEPPMILHACKLLETMEKTVMTQGDDVPFVITGQVFMYRGANYLLPSIVKREYDRGNLE
ncbi:MAG: hypothetical protein ACPGYV_10785 [Phycisphaeraceae bacterium]